MISNRLIIVCVSILFLVLSFANVAVGDSTWTVFTEANSPLTSNLISSIGFDDTGNQYVCTSGGGLVIRNDSSWTIFNESNTGAPINAVRVVARDANDNLWLGAATGNLDSSPQGFGVAKMASIDSTWSMENGGIEVNQIVTGVMVNGTRRCVTTYGGGVTIYSDLGWVRYRVTSRAEFSYADSQLQIFDVPPGTYLPSDYIRAFDYDPLSGAAWFGTADGGAVHMVGTEWTTYNIGNSGIPSNQILSVKIDPATDNVYFGTAGMGAAVFDGISWQIYNQSNSPMVNPFITTIEVDLISGDIWFGTAFNIIVRQPDTDWRTYLPGQNNLVWGDFYSDISFDPNGNVWVSAYNGGMAVMLPEIPPPPPPLDSLYIAFEKLNITFAKNSPVEKITTIFNVINAPELIPEDTISFRLSSSAGELYLIDAVFGDFRQTGPGNHYRYKAGATTIVLKYNSENMSLADITIRDRDAEMIRENYSDQLMVTFKMGPSVGGGEVLLLNSNNTSVAENTPGLNATINSSLTFKIDSEPVSKHGQYLSDSDIAMFNYPNPFNGQTVISFNLQSASNVSVSVYDILGRRVDELHSGYLASGIHRFAWPDNGASANYKTGVYYYTVLVDNINNTGKMIYLK